MFNAWKIDYMAMHDGPGVRTSVYFKGCHLKCLWCSNPEGQTFKPNLIFRQLRCIGCGLCIEKCLNKCIGLQIDHETQQTSVNLELSNCTLCGECVYICPTKALEIWGETYQIYDLLKIFKKNRPLYRKTGGGVTFTGGDPMCQGEAALELLKQCRKQGIHTVIETSAYGDEDVFEKILGEVDWMFIDLKHMDPEVHTKLTGKRNDLILQNLKRASSVLYKRNRTLVVRMVVVPGLNDGENIIKAAKFLSSLPYLKGVEFLAYHRYGVNKYEVLNLNYQLPDLQPPSEELMNKCKSVMASFGIKVI